MSFAKTKPNILPLNFCFRKYCAMVLVLTVKEYCPKNNRQLGILFLYANNLGLYIFIGQSTIIKIIYLNTIIRNQHHYFSDISLSKQQSKILRSQVSMERTMLPGRE